jgi:hypothetical protein
MREPGHEEHSGTGTIFALVHRRPYAAQTSENIHASKQFTPCLSVFALRGENRQAQM